MRDSFCHLSAQAYYISVSNIERIYREFVLSFLCNYNCEISYGQDYEYFSEYFFFLSK